LKIDKQLKDMSDRLNAISNNGNGSSGIDDYDDNYGLAAADGHENDKSWFCVFCNSTHFQSGECPQSIFGAGDKYCTICNKVHYDSADCPRGGKWCYYCSEIYVNAEEHFNVHKQDDTFNRFVKENPSWTIEDRTLR
jgi:hypothetical protein